MQNNNDIILFWMPEWNGFHVSAWHDTDSPGSPLASLKWMRQMVQAAERGKVHGCFLADQLVVGFEGVGVSKNGLSRTAKGVRYEPITLMSALAGCTERIGLIGTANTTFNEPFHVARQFASLDHLSGGRAGWNVVTGTGPAEAINFGRDHAMTHATRYERGQEFFDVVCGLWDSWEDDAFICDRASGIFFDPDKLHTLDYHGDHLAVAGPLNIVRPVQGHPVIAQAGSSEAGRAFAARNADVIYTIQTDLEKGKAFYAEVKEQVAEAGRDPDHVKILPGLIPVLGRSQADADEKLARLDGLVAPEVGMDRLNSLLQTDLSEFPLDGPVPDMPETELGAKSRQQRFLDRIRRDNLTVREAMQVAARLNAVAGTATSIADIIQEWVEAGAADGMNVTFADASDSMHIFVDELIPELQRRGVFHTDYRGSTLRDSLGIPRPANRFLQSLR